MTLPEQNVLGGWNATANCTSIFVPLLNIHIHGQSIWLAKLGLCMHLAGEGVVMDCRSTNLDPVGKKSGAVKKEK